MKLPKKLVWTLVFTATVCLADVRLPNLIGDHMLLQRDMPARIFGKASPRESVLVSFRGQDVRTSADTLGRWEVWLKPMQPGAAADMTIQGNNTVRLSDVLVGDVWIGSGQSNMQWAVRQADNAPAEMSAANYDQIRLFYVPRKPSPVPVDDVNAKWIVCSPDTVGEFSAVLYFFGRDLHKQLNVPMGLIHSSWGGTPIASWISGPTLTSNPRLAPFLTFWQNQILHYPANYAHYEMNVKKWEEAGKQGPRPATPLGPGNPHEPTTLFNGMIAPLMKYTIKGALWYQGETEAGRAQGNIYGEAMKTLVEDWRQMFAEGDFPFFWVQLANYGNATKNGHWMNVQEGQVKATDLKRTGVVVINDIGNATSIHPTNKQDVGKRLALMARHVAYGQSGFEWSSPLFRQVTQEGDTIRIWFDHADGLKTRDGGLVRGFVVAGADGKFVPASARIEGSTVVVSSPDVKNPEMVRYAWDYNPDANLVNGAGLPASLFRTDDRDEFAMR